MSRRVKESSSSNNTSLDEIKALINGRFNELNEKLALVEEKFEKTTKQTEESRIKTSKKSDEIEGLKFQISDQTSKLASRTRQRVS